MSSQVLPGVHGASPAYIYPNVLEWQASASAPELTQAAPTSDVATQNLTIGSQAPYASAATNTRGGHIVLQLPTTVSGGSQFPYVLVGYNGQYPVGFTESIAGVGAIVFRADIAGRSPSIEAGTGGPINFYFSSTQAWQMSGSTLNMSNPGQAYTISQIARLTDAATNALSIASQSALSTAATNVNGGGLQLQSGASKTNGTTGLRGPIRVQLGQQTAQTGIELAEVAVGQRVVALAQMGSGVTTTQVPTGDGVVYVGNAATNPSSNPTSGGVIYVSSGALTYRGSSGTTTTLAPA